jgi:hypothetical protein
MIGHESFALPEVSEEKMYSTAESRWSALIPESLLLLVARFGIATVFFQIFRAADRKVMMNEVREANTPQRFISRSRADSARPAERTLQSSPIKELMIERLRSCLRPGDKVTQAGPTSLRYR